MTKKIQKEAITSMNDEYGLSKMKVGDSVNIREEDFKRAVSTSSSLSKNRTKVFTTCRADLTIRRVG